ncbi:MAG: hypothetical protein ACON5F_10830 [Jejuia sp.]
MGNKIFAIPIKQLLDNKEDRKTKAFISNLEIDLSKMTDCRDPTLNDLKMAISDSGFKIERESYSKQKEWACEIKELNMPNTEISISQVNSEKEFIECLINFPYGNWETIIEILFQLEKFIGPILFYSDSGSMTLIRKNKTVNQIIEEMNKC